MVDVNAVQMPVGRPVYANIIIPRSGKNVSNAKRSVSKRHSGHTCAYYYVTRLLQRFSRDKRIQRYRMYCNECNQYALRL